MSKPVKEMMLADYQRRFAGVDNALLIDIRGIDANKNNTLRLDLATKQIKVTIVKNTLARKAFAGTALEPLSAAIEGPSALAYGAESVVEVARELVDWATKIEHLELKAAVLDGELFSGKAAVSRLSRFPTKVEAQARVVQLVLAPAGRVVGAATGPAARILGIVKEIRTRLEQGETIEKS